MTLRQVQGERIEYTGKLWRWSGATGTGVWFFVTIDGAAGEALSATALMRRMEGSARGFGSIKVQVTIGESRFNTSVFPQKGPDVGRCWLLPVKASVRKAEGIGEGDLVEVGLEF
ncbi:MAG: DUF1905 domain-containing protein [Novosphingobium sp.]